MEIILSDITISLGGKILLDHLNLRLKHGEHWAFTGFSGSGKTLLAKSIAGQLFHRGRVTFLNDKGVETKPKIILIEQQHHFKNRSNVANFYLQQRYNSADAEDALSIREELNTFDPAETNYWIAFFCMQHAIDKPLIQLSNGENKRFQLIKAMLLKPDLILLDNPFLGLDKTGRALLEEALVNMHGLGIGSLLFNSAKQLPEYITHVARLVNGKIENVCERDEWKTTNYSANSYFPEWKTKMIKQLFRESNLHYHHVVHMQKLSILYGEIPVLQDINWTVRQSERWSISGPNGSGKSTLLSLIAADNPQAYANEIILFDRKRGSGESIWDIKKQIGFLSPELHLYFEKGLTAFEAVASGLFDTIGLFRKPGPSETAKINDWLQLLELSSIANKMLHQLSLGEQRMVMLARALVKAPPLLILDEPCQGLDDHQTEAFKQLIDALCNFTDLTLIYISHYAEDIPSSITHKLELDKGKIVNR